MRNASLWQGEKNHAWRAEWHKMRWEMQESFGVSTNPHGPALEQYLILTDRNN